MGIIAWLIGSRLGRLLSGALGLLAAVGGVFLAGRSAGAKKAKNKALKKRVDDLEKAKEVRDEVDAMDADDVRDGLAKWVRDDD